MHIPHTSRPIIRAYVPIRASVADDLVRWQKLLIMLMLCLILSAFYYTAIAAYVLRASAVLYLIVMLLKHALFWFGAYIKVARSDNTPIGLLNDARLPIYSIIVALYDEAPVLPHLIASLQALDYPKTKLQIILVLESHDIATIQAAENLLRAQRENCGHYEILIAPSKFPQTKASACNYALTHVRGRLLAIYDAEDCPDPQQLRYIASLYHQAPDNVGCIQCQLGCYNANETWLTKMFAMEYTALFGCTLPALSMLGAPILLGGSSNHFRTDILRKCQGWDDFNVTEDADLGLYLHQAGYVVQVVNSQTMEEAPLDLHSWAIQRARWIKGHALTYLVHMRVGHSQNLFIHVWLGAATLATLLSPIMLALWLVMLLQDVSCISVFTSLGKAALIMHCLLSWLQGYYICGRQHSLRWLCYPLYFAAHMLAACVALKQLLYAPYKWDKTAHGKSSFCQPIDHNHAKSLKNSS